MLQWKVWMESSRMLQKCRRLLNKHM
jgi:hypothetical protein